MSNDDLTQAVRRLQFPKLTATRGDADRIERLGALFDEVAQVTGNRRLLLGKLIQFDFDSREMVLTVLWSAEPTSIERQAVNDCWVKSGEGGPVRHLVEPKGEFDL